MVEKDPISQVVSRELKDLRVYKRKHRDSNEFYCFIYYFSSNTKLNPIRNMSIVEYADKIESLAKHFCYFGDHVNEKYMCELFKKKKYMCERFDQGLRCEIKESMTPLEIHQFQVLVEKCKEGGADEERV